MIDLRQSFKYLNHLKQLGWNVKSVTNGCSTIFRKFPLIPLYFSKCQRPETLPVKDLEQVAKDNHAIISWIEPTDEQQVKTLIENGYKLSKSPFLPTKTIRLELSKEVDNQFTKDCRYSIRKAEKNGLKITQTNSIPDFHRVWKKSVGWQKFVPSLKSLESLKSSFKKNAVFLIASRHSDPPAESADERRIPLVLSQIAGDPSVALLPQDDKIIIAGLTLLISDNTAYYYYAFNSKDGRLKLAQYLLVHKAIEYARGVGCRYFDFEGIYDHRFPINSWKGFTHFKKSFGGEEIEYPGCFRKIISRPRK